MDNILLFIGYFLFSLVTIKLACLLFGIHNKDKRILLISLLGCTADYVVQEFIEPKIGLSVSLHFFTGIILITFSCYFLLSLNVGLSFSISVLSYILGIISEVITILFITNIWGREVLSSLIKNNYTRTIVGMVTLIPLVIPIIYLQTKKINLFNTNI